MHKLHSIGILSRCYPFVYSGTYSSYAKLARGVIIMTASVSELEDVIAHLRDLDLRGLRARWHSVFRRKAPLSSSAHAHHRGKVDRWNKTTANQVRPVLHPPRSG
jgi:hypothetical protein